MSSSQDPGVADEGTSTEIAASTNDEVNGDLPRELAFLGWGSLDDAAILECEILEGGELLRTKENV